MIQKDSQKQSSKIPTVILYIVSSIFSLLIGLYIFFPRDELRSRFEQELSQERTPQSPPWATGYSVTIEELDLHIFKPGIHLKNIQFVSVSKTEVSSSEKKSKPRRFIIDSFDLYISWWDLILGRLPPPKLEVEISAFGGELQCQIEEDIKEDGADPKSLENSSGYKITLSTSKLNIGNISNVFTSIPMTGTMEISSKLILPFDAKTKHTQLQNLKGNIQFSVDDFVFSQEKTKLSLNALPDPAQTLIRPMLEKFSPSGIPIPKIRFGKMKSELLFKNQQVTFQNWKFSSGDQESQNKQEISLNLLIDGSMTLRENLGMSSTNLYLRMGPWKKLFDKVIDGMKEALDPQKDATTIKEIEEQLRPLSDLVKMQERADGFLGILLTGPISKLNPPKLEKTHPDKMNVQSTIR